MAKQDKTPKPIKVKCDFKKCKHNKDGDCSAARVLLAERAGGGYNFCDQFGG